MSLKRRRIEDGEEYELNMNSVTKGKQCKNRVNDISSKPWIFVINPTQPSKHNDWKRIFGPYGKVIDIVVKSEFGLASVQIDKRIDTDNGVKQLAGIQMDDKKVLVRFSTAGKSARISTCLTSSAPTSQNIQIQGRVVKVENLSPLVTNELLRKAFEKFGRVISATVIVDSKGRSTTKGKVVFSSKTAALYAVHQIEQGCFLLTASPRPISASLMDQEDSICGLPEEKMNNTPNYCSETSVEPRFALQGSFEEECAKTWKVRYHMEKRQRDQVEENIRATRALFESQMQTCCDQVKQQVQLVEQQQMELNKSPIQAGKPRISIAPKKSPQIKEKQDGKGQDVQIRHRCQICHREFAQVLQLRRHLDSCLMERATTSSANVQNTEETSSSTDTVGTSNSSPESPQRAKRVKLGESSGLEMIEVKSTSRESGPVTRSNTNERSVEDADASTSDVPTTSTVESTDNALAIVEKKIETEPAANEIILVTNDESETSVNEEASVDEEEAASNEVSPVMTDEPDETIEDVAEEDNGDKTTTDDLGSNSNHRRERRRGRAHTQPNQSKKEIKRKKRKLRKTDYIDESDYEEFEDTPCRLCAKRTKDGLDAIRDYFYGSEGEAKAKCFLQNHGLLPKGVVCPRCGSRCTHRPSRGTYICNTESRSWHPGGIRQRCGYTTSEKRGTFFVSTHLKYCHVLLLAFHYCRRQAIKLVDVERHLNLSKGMVYEWGRRFGEICLHFASHQQPIGGPGVEVSLDEMTITERKEGYWMFGGVERGVSPRRFLIFRKGEPNTSEHTDYVTKYVREGSSITTSVQPGYNQLSSMGYKHSIVSGHVLPFVRRISLGNGVVCGRGITFGMDTDYMLARYVFINCFDDETTRFHEFLTEMGKVYPVLTDTTDPSEPLVITGSEIT